MEAARTAAINQEINLVLTEVLLKVALGITDKFLFLFTQVLTVCYLDRLLMNFFMKLLRKFLMKMIPRLKVVFVHKLCTDTHTQILFFEFPVSFSFPIAFLP